MMNLDRRHWLGCAAGAGTLVLRGAARAQTPPAVAPAAPPEPRPLAPKPPPRPAWINFEYGITWERMNVLQEVVANLVDRGTTEITLMISSSGGDMAAAISCYEFLTSAGIRLTTYVIGNCYSAALLLLLAGERRVCDRPGQLIIHPAAAVMGAGSSTLDALKLRSESLDRDTRRLRDIVLARSRITADKLDPMLFREGVFVEPRQALDYGLVTEVAHLERPSNALLLTLPVPRTVVP